MKNPSTNVVFLYLIFGDTILVCVHLQNCLAHSLLPGDMLLSVNGTGLKSMTHQQAVELITQQSNRVELELVERAECHGDRVESDSNNSIGKWDIQYYL